MRNLNCLTISLLLLCNVLNAQWQQTNAPVCPGVVELAANENALFALSASYEIFATSNNGENWNKTNMTSRWSLTTDNNKVYTSTSENLHISSDNGQTFSSVSAMADYGHVSCDGTILTLSEDIGLKTSIDDGKTWTDTQIDALYMSKMVTFKNNLIGGTINGLFTSSDKGFTWEYVAFNDKQVMSVATDNDNLYATIYNEGIYCSTNDGASWQKLNTGLEKTSDCRIKNIDNDIWLIDRFDGVYKLNESSWVNKSYDLPKGLKLTDIIFFKNQIFVSSKYNGVFKLKNNNWIHCSNGLESSTIISSIFYNNNRLFSSISSGLYVSNDLGNTWQWNNSTSIFTCFYKHNELIYVGTSEGIYTSANNGDSWDLLTSEKKYITNIIVVNNAIYCANWKGVYKSTNDGSTWVNFNTGLPGNFDLISLAIKDDMLFASSWNHKVYKSPANQAAWTSANNGLNNNLCKSFFVLDTIVFVSDWWNGIYKTIDDGETWTYSGLDGKCIVDFKQWNNYLFAATWEDGIFYSTDKGENWTAYNDGLNVPFTSPDSPYQTFETLTIGEKYMYAGGTNTKVWKCLLPGMTETTSVAINNSKPSQFSIYPNPAKNYINFKDPEFHFNEVEIYNTQGQLTTKAKCTDGKIDISTLKPGVFIVKMANGDNIQMKKFIKQ